jgi:hypothetical protein
MTAITEQPPQPATQAQKKKKASLQPLTAALPNLSLDGFSAALRASALHLQSRDEEIDSDHLRKSLGDAVYEGTTMTQLLNSCCHLLRQAGRKGGMTSEKLFSSLVPLGFEEAHVLLLIEVLQWVRSGSPTSESTAGKSSPPASPPPTEPAVPEEAEAPEQTVCSEAEPPEAVAATVQPQEETDAVLPDPGSPELQAIQEDEDEQEFTIFETLEQEPEPEPEEALTPRAEAALASKYLGRLSHVAEDAAQIQVKAMDSEAKATRVNTLPSGKWGMMTWQERLVFLQSCPTVEQATVATQRREKLGKRINAKPPLDAYVITAPFNGSVLKPPAWREDEDLSLVVGDIVVSVGPAPYGKRGWSVGFRVDEPCRYKIFPSSKNYVRRLRSADVSGLSNEALGVLSKFDEKETDRTAGYTAVPRVSIEAVEVTGAVTRASTAVDSVGRQVEKRIAYYSIHCAGPTGESWTVQRRYSEFEQLRNDLLHATSGDGGNVAGLSREEVASLSFPSKHTALSGNRLREVRVNSFNAWLSSVHTATSGLGRTSHAYILLRRFLRPASPLRQKFSGFEHDGKSYPQVNLQVYPDTDAKGTGEFVAMRLGITAVSTFVAQLSKFITANGRLRLEVDQLVPAGLGVQYVLVLPSDDSAETAVNRFAMRVKEEYDFVICESVKKTIAAEVKQRMRRV